MADIVRDHQSALRPLSTRAPVGESGDPFRRLALPEYRWPALPAIGFDVKPALGVNTWQDSDVVLHLRPQLAVASAFKGEDFTRRLAELCSWIGDEFAHCGSGLDEADAQKSARVIHALLTADAQIARDAKIRALSELVC